MFSVNFHLEIRSCYFVTVLRIHNVKKQKIIECQNNFDIGHPKAKIIFFYIGQFFWFLTFECPISKCFWYWTFECPMSIFFYIGNSDVQNHFIFFWLSNVQYQFFFYIGLSNVQYQKKIDIGHSNVQCPISNILLTSGCLCIWPRRCVTNNFHVPTSKVKVTERCLRLPVWIPFRSITFKCVSHSVPMNQVWSKQSDSLEDMSQNHWTIDSRSLWRDNCRSW